MTAIGEGFRHLGRIERFRLRLEASKIATAIVNPAAPRARIVYVNAAFERATGLSRAMAVRLRLDEVHECGAGALSHARMTSTLRHADGRRVRCCVATIGLMLPDGYPLRLLLHYPLPRADARGVGAEIGRLFAGGDPAAAASDSAISMAGAMLTTTRSITLHAERALTITQSAMRPG